MLKKIPDDTIIFISGVPGAGKTTISYELLKKYNAFRIVQETDIIREILRGYNEYVLDNPFNSKVYLPNIFSHNKLLTYEEAKAQCEIMKYSIQYIIERQKRKNIPTIINGVHIIPEILSELISDAHTKYINLFFDCEKDLYEHIKERDCDKYGIKNVSFLFSQNNKLQNSMDILHSKKEKSFKSINVGKLSIAETLDIIINFIQDS